MAKKEWREVPESELTEEEVRRWFNRLRELFKESQYRIHGLKVERGKLRVELQKLKKDLRVLRGENERLKEGGVEKGCLPKRVKAKVEMADYKKKFLDSL